MDNTEINGMDNSLIDETASCNTALGNAIERELPENVFIRRPAIHRPLTSRHVLIRAKTPSIVYIKRILSLLSMHPSFAITNRTLTEARLAFRRTKTRLEKTVTVEAMGHAISKLEWIVNQVKEKNANITITTEHGSTVVVDDCLSTGSVQRRNVPTCRVTITNLFP